MDIRSMLSLVTLRGIFPTAWAASVWKNTPLARHMPPVDGTPTLASGYILHQRPVLTLAQHYILYNPSAKLHANDSPELRYIQTSVVMVTYFSDRLLDSDLVVDGHDGDDRRVRAEGRLQELHTQDGG